MAVRCLPCLATNFRRATHHHAVAFGPRYTTRRWFATWRSRRPRKLSTIRKALALIKKISPAAWRHLQLNGHYTFRGGGKTIDLDALVAELTLG